MIQDGVRDVRIVGFKQRDANGIFGTLNDSNIIDLVRRMAMEAEQTERNIYINAVNRPQLRFTSNAAASRYYGHLFKVTQLNIAIHGCVL